ncbi:hypothetical protein Bca52824_054219 [Brassica carinata]|uniref:RNase H type-1 domain-containing protein n=1 Tax=Brassica carinata TaxID=52824 RepID=A0A8X7RD34_BRACI|nr:hypothetical protein Bca52824_054219 [Brassica carinata]
MKQGLITSIGDGKSTNVWSTNWVMDSLPRPPLYHPSNPINLSLKVSDLLVEHTGFWNSTMLKRTFAEDDVHRILAIQARPSHLDSLRWGFTPFGSYTSKSGYKLLEDLIDLNGSNNVFLPPLEKQRLRSRNINVVATCNACGHHTETILRTRTLTGAYGDLSHGSSGIYGKLETRCSLKRLKLQIIFEFSLAGLRDALSSPESYPQFLCLFEDLQSMLNRMDSWCLCLVSPTENRASESIARSVTRDNRSQSYVAQNGPVWLTTILQADAMGTL